MSLIAKPTLEHVVLIAGKGHEAWQEEGGTRHPFDDRAVARQAFT